MAVKRVARKTEEDYSLGKYGGWAFILGLVITLVAAYFAPGSSSIMLVLAVLGIVVGVLNVTDRELLYYLVATLTFLLCATTLKDAILWAFGSIPLATNFLINFMQYVVFFVAPGATIVALKAIYLITKEPESAF